MKWNDLTIAMSVIVLLGIGLVSSAEAQSGAYRHSGRSIAVPSGRTYHAATHRVNYARKVYGPTVSEPIPTSHEHGDSCGRCCPAIIPTLLNGISNALDCLLPCRGCGISRGCDDCGKGVAAPTRTYRAPCGGCGLGILPIFSYRFNQGSHCSCYGGHGVPSGHGIPHEAPAEEVIPKPVPDKEAAPRSARRLPTFQERTRYQTPQGDGLRLAPPRAATPRELQKYGRTVKTESAAGSTVIRTGYSRSAVQPQRGRVSTSPRNPLR